MNRSASSLFLVSLIAFAVAAAALILTIPALFGEHVPNQAWLTGLLSGLTLVFGVAALALRPHRGTSPKDTHRH